MIGTILKELEMDRLIIRKEYPQIPPKVEYSLSDRGKSLMDVLDQLCIWGEENREEYNICSGVAFNFHVKESLRCFTKKEACICFLFLREYFKIIFK